MNKHLVAIITVLIVIVSGSCICTSQKPSNQWGQIIQQSNTAITSITICTVTDSSVPVFAGSGFFISSNGYLATSYHVISQALEQPEIWNIWAYINERDKLSVEVIALNTSHDIAILKVEANDLDYLELEDEFFASQGDNIITIGNAYPFMSSVTPGIVSKIYKKDSLHIIQMTAPVNPGCSGGPIINSRGKVIGIVTAIAPSYNGIYFGVDIHSLYSTIGSRIEIME